MTPRGPPSICRTTGRSISPSTRIAISTTTAQAARPRVPRHEHRLVPPDVRHPRVRRGPPHRDRVRRRLPRLHRHPQRPLRGPQLVRLRAVPVRRHGSADLRRQECARRARGRDRVRRLVLRRRRDLSPRLAREDRAGSRRALGHVRPQRLRRGHGNGIDRDRRAKRRRRRGHVPRRVEDRRRRPAPRWRRSRPRRYRCPSGAGRR